MTPRQKKLLQAIIDDFIESAEAVGSLHLTRKYKLNLSPATIRNEMADLVKLGYLEQAHTSSGRIPTTMGYKVFVESIMNDLYDLDNIVENTIKEELFQRRFDLDDLIYKALDELTNRTDCLAFAIFGNRIYYSGFSRFVARPEFSDSVKLQKILMAIENHHQMKEMLEKFTQTKDVRVLFGDDTGIQYFTNTALIYKLIRVHADKECFIGIVGPTRIDYQRSIAVVDFVASSINDILLAW